MVGAAAPRGTNWWGMETFNMHCKRPSRSYNSIQRSGWSSKHTPQISAFRYAKATSALQILCCRTGRSHYLFLPN